MLSSVYYSMRMKKNKVLIIRFSSFGDIVQCSSVIESIYQTFDEIHWATRSDFKSLVGLNAHLAKIWSFDKKEGLFGLIKFALELRSENFTHVYDAHNNMRSNILKLFLMTRWKRPILAIRSKERVKRILLFQFKINKFPNPFIGINSFRAPLKKWGVLKTQEAKLVSWNFPSSTKEKMQALKLSLAGVGQMVVLVPSAAWEMKRWPLEHWKNLIKLMPSTRFVILGGKEDASFCQELAEIDLTRVHHLAGKLSLIESSQMVELASLVISADTGLLHVADVLGIKALSLMGPTAFGFTLSPLITTMDVDLLCRPCTKDGRGKCSQSVYQRCMVEITPSRVASVAQDLLRE